MKKFNLLLLLALLFAVGGAKAQAYTESDLTDAGWEVVTSLDNATVSQYVYVFYSVEGKNLMLAQGYVDGYQQNLLTGVYRTATNPIEEESMVWTLEYSDDLKYGLRNLSNPSLYMQSRGTGKDGKDNVGPWNIQFEWERSQSQWTCFDLAYSDESNSWTIENNVANYQGKFIGPWDENVQDPTSCFADGKAVAGNKTGDYVGHFKLYRMKKAVYYGKKYYPEFTAVTGTNQLTDKNMAANYYIIVAETNPDLAVTASNKVDDPNVRLKYVTQSVFTNAAQIWTLQANDGDGYSFRNLKKDHGLLQTYNDNSADNGAWACAILDIQSPEALTKFIPTSDGDNGFIIENGSHTGKYLGLWTVSNGYKDNEKMAANKSGNNIAHFYIYSISRSDYKTQFLANNSEVTDLFMTNPHVENAYGWEGDNVDLYSPSNYVGVYTGATDNVVLDKNPQYANMHQQVTLPTGSYILKVATRAATNQGDAWLYVYDSSKPGDLDRGYILKKGDQYDEGALNYGWNWNYMAFTLDSEKTVQIGFYKAQGSWASADDFHLYKGVVTMNETNTSVDFSAGEHANVVVNRNITGGKWATLSLPFAMAKPYGWEVRELNSVEESDGVYTLNFTEATSLEAGKPYMVKTAENVTRIVATDVTVLTEPVDQTVDGVTMKGVFTSGNVPEGQYFVSGNKFYRAADDTNSMKAFRAYFEINGSNNARSLILNFDETTSITSLEGQQLATMQPEAVFDLSGRRQTRLVPGINIVRQADGTVKKVFVK